MDAYNIAWHAERAKNGYPAGYFGDGILEMVFDPPRNLRNRLVDLNKIYLVADGENLAALETLMPGTLDTLKQLEKQEITVADALLAMRALLLTLPQVLATLPIVKAAIREYAALE